MNRPCRLDENSLSLLPHLISLISFQFGSQSDVITIPWYRVKLNPTRCSVFTISDDIFPFPLDFNGTSNLLFIESDIYLKGIWQALPKLDMLNFYTIVFCFIRTFCITVPFTSCFEHMIQVRHLKEIRLKRSRTFWCLPPSTLCCLNVVTCFCWRPINVKTTSCAYWLTNYSLKDIAMYQLSNKTISLVQSKDCSWDRIQVSTRRRFDFDTTLLQRHVLTGILCFKNTQRYLFALFLTGPWLV